MATTAEGGERIILSPLDTRILVALLLDVMGGYKIARQCERDTHDQQKVSNGALYFSLKGLERSGFIESVDVVNQTTKNFSKGYRITSSGKMVLGWKIDSLKETVKLARERNLEKNP